MSVSITVIVATVRDRLDLLLDRCLPSVFAQGHAPDRLVVVLDDAPKGPSEREVRACRYLLRSYVDEWRERIQREFGEAGPLAKRFRVVHNYRTLGRASGAWNTGIVLAARQARARDSNGSDRFVAFLDDDDEWLPDHLQRCFDACVTRSLHMAAPGFIRKESEGELGEYWDPPERLDPRLAFVGGHGIQGSNLFVRLDKLVACGGFDEYLPSCTDRDISIRLADLPGFKYERIAAHTMIHYADPRPDRLTTPGSHLKTLGLDRFWRKYQRRFDDDARKKCIARATEFFGWHPPVPSPVGEGSSPRPTRSKEKAASSMPPDGLAAESSIHLVVGFATDATCPGHVRGLLDDLTRLRDRVGLLRVIVVENGPLPTSDGRPLAAAVAEARQRGLDVRLVAIEQTAAAWDAGHIRQDMPDIRAKRLPIPWTRTLLAERVGRAAVDVNGWAWILDDDKRLMVVVEDDDGTTHELVRPDLQALLALRERGAAIVIGEDSGAAPLPFAATVRLQMLDLVYSLRILETQGLEAAWHDGVVENHQLRSDLADSHYDLSRHTAHLEVPFEFVPSTHGATGRDVLLELGRRVRRVLAGEQVFRPLRLSSRRLPAGRAVYSTLRGGSALFFDPFLLLRYPHTVCRLGKRYVRRSDMVVTRLMVELDGAEAYQHAAVAVNHDRSHVERDGVSLDGLVAVLSEDILGYATYRTIDGLFEARRAQPRTKAPRAAWTAEEIDRAYSDFEKAVSERVDAFHQNAERTLALAGQAREVAQRLTRACYDEPARAALAAICDEVGRVEAVFREAVVRLGYKRLLPGHDTPGSAIQELLESMDASIADFRQYTLDPDDAVRRQDDETRKARTRESATAAGADPARLEFLGLGGEGVVWHDDRTVFKVLDSLRKPRRLEALRSLCEQEDIPRHLGRPRMMRVGELDVVTYAFEELIGYERVGGLGNQMLELLGELRRLGLVFNNLHPKNLMITAGPGETTLKLVDYGTDLVRPTLKDYAAEFEKMARRAYLTWRWSAWARDTRTREPGKDPLEGPMRRSLVSDDIPELVGYEDFHRCLHDARLGPTDAVASMILERIAALRSPPPAGRPLRVLDYGCGKRPVLARRIATLGHEVVGYDPDSVLVDRWSGIEPPPTLTLETDLARALKHRYDIVTCNLVLDDILNDHEYHKAISAICSAVRDDGRVLLSICNPFATFGPPTPLHRRRELPSHARYEHRFDYAEVVSSHGRPRKERHRSLSSLERDLLSHGLRVVSRVESPATADTERFEPASDFLVLECERITLSRPEARISLLIKACAMEADTIEVLVEHLVRQLEGPRTFCERVLALDGRTDGFARQYTPGSLDRLRAAAGRLVERDLVDRVLESPAEPEEIRAVNRRWFGVDSADTHSGRGTPLTSQLAAFEACVGDYILQTDADILIHRSDRGADWLGQLVEALEANPGAVTIAPPIVGREGEPVSATAVDASGQSGPCRVEVRFCLLHRTRLLAALPLPADIEPRAGLPPWYRAADAAARTGRFSSLRGGSRGLAFIHPQNEIKASPTTWLRMVDLVERLGPPGQAAEKGLQDGAVDLRGGPLAWLQGRGRKEPFVFVVTGRNVRPGRMRRCLDSIRRQRGDWGAVVIDDHSDPLTAEYLELSLRDDPRFTLLRPRLRMGQLAQTAFAIRNCVDSPETVIVTVDIDDALIGTGVLERLGREYSAGADATVGSMLRVEKPTSYPADFDQPRNKRGGYVWQHLRTFRKLLFDSIPDHMLRDAQGEYFDRAVDWAFMLCIIERAEKPVHIADPLYLYERSVTGLRPEQKQAAEEEIGRICAKPPLLKLARQGPACPVSHVKVDSDSEPSVVRASFPEHGVVVLRHGDRRPFADVPRDERDSEPLTDEGRLLAEELGRQLPTHVCFVASPTRRTRETAAGLLRGLGRPADDYVVDERLVRLRVGDGQSDHSQPLYAAQRERLGWRGVVTEWLEGTESAAVRPVWDVCVDLFRAAQEHRRACGSDLVVLVTHDFIVDASLQCLRGRRESGVAFFGAAHFSWDEVADFLRSRYLEP